MTSRNRSRWSWALVAVIVPLISCSDGGDLTGPGPTTPNPPGQGPGAPAPQTASLTLSWDGPTVNEDGTPLTDLAGYNLYYGRTSPVTVDNSTLVELATVTTATLSDLTTGVYFIAVAARDTNGNVSALSTPIRAEVNP